MKRQEYMIGDVSAITGISRDALRFYEKKGILASRKKANGYRYFTEDDLYRLVHIFFSRRLNFDLDTIGEFLGSAVLCPEYQKILLGQITEELNLISRHRQALHRLLSMKKIFEGMEPYMNLIGMAPFPPSRVITALDSPSEGLRRWFALSQEYPELDMAYLYDCYQYQSGFSLSCPETDGPSKDSSPASYEGTLTYCQTLLVLYEEIIELLKPDYDLSHCSGFSPGSCIHTVAESDSFAPQVSLIAAMRRQALEQGLIPSSQVFVSANFSRIHQDSAVYCQEIYIPILPA